MDYKTLQQEAAKLGIKAVGVKRDVLEKMVMEAKSEGQEPKAETKPEKKTEKKEQPVPKDMNTAIVLHGSREVRRYTNQDHGKDFAKLAYQFAGKSGYSVSFIKVDFDNKCPHCGHQL